MGTGSSFLHSNEEEDGVVKRIPDEVKPRGRIGIHNSLGRKKTPGASLRSALSVELDNPEVERIKREWDMYKLNMDNDISNIQKKEQKLETENRRLRTELQALQMHCKKLQQERDGALEAEHQALVRAAAFESDRDKIQRQFKIFRETKESEIQNLLKAKRDLETRLAKVSQGLIEDLDTSSRVDTTSTLGACNPGDWWAALESDPSLGSTTQLHMPAFRGPEFAHGLLDSDGPFTNVNKDDWTVAAASLAQVIPAVPESLQANTIRVYISAPSDVHREVDLVFRDYEKRLEKLCMAEGRFFLLIHMPCSNKESEQEDKLSPARCRQIDQASIFLAFLGHKVDRMTEMEYNMGHLKDPRAIPAIFCFKDTRQKKPTDEAANLQKRVRETGGMKLIEDYGTAQRGAELAYLELEKIIKKELGLDISNPQEPDLTDSFLELDGPEALCGGCLWDPMQDYEQMEALSYAQRSTCELGFEKYYERLNAHVCRAGPLPPLLVTGPPGSGKTLLLAKWIELNQQKSSSCLLVYHFVGTDTSASADPLVMIRRLTAQLMQQVTSPPALTCDPVRLLEEFPRWLEKVSSKVPGGVVLVLDAADRFQHAESKLKWLLDPLPVDLRVLVSSDVDKCPQAWKSWPSLHIEELANKSVKELLRADLARLGHSLAEEHESQILTHCRTTETCVPLYVVIMASELARCNSHPDCVKKRVDIFVSTSDCVQLYKAIFDILRQEYETSDSKGLMRKVLRLIYASRNGLCESELFQLIPGLTWNFWAPLCDALLDRHVLTYRSGLLVFAQHQARLAVEQKFFSDADKKMLDSSRQTIREHYAKFMGPGDCTYRVADELPWQDWQLGNKEHVHHDVLDLCIFVKLYGRGRCGELITYWQYVGADKASMAKAYLSATKQMEEMVGMFNGLVTLPRIADVYESVGRFLKDLGILNEALDCLRRALEIRETALDPDHPCVAQSLHQVAGLHAQWGKFATAEALYKQAIDIYNGAFGSDHYLVAKELDALAVLYQKQGKHDLADPIHRRALSIRRKTRVPRVTSGRIRGADPLRRRALKLDELATSSDSADAARTLNELGVLYYLQNSIDTAEAFFVRALEMRENVLESDHPDVSQSLNNLAALYNDKKLYDKAEPLYERALVIRKKHFPADHPSIDSISRHLAVLYKKLGKHDKALPLYEQAVELRESAFHSNHPSVATALVNLAVLCSQQGNHTDALPLFERALKIYEDNFGPNHPRVAETMRNLAVLKYDLGEYKMAAKLYKRATDLKESESTAYTSKAPSRHSSTLETSSTTTKNELQNNASFYGSQELDIK